MQIILNDYCIDDILMKTMNFSELYIYGTGEVASYLYELYGDALTKEHKKITFIKSNVKDNEKFHNHDVFSFHEIEYNNENGVMIIATHEIFQEEIIELVTNIYTGIIMCFSEHYIADMISDCVENHRKNRGIASVCFADITNMGDQLNKFIIDKMFGLKIVSEGIEKSNFVCIGSSMNNLFVDDTNTNRGMKYELNILGNGFLSDMDLQRKKTIRDKINFIGVRGLKTKEKLEFYFQKRIVCKVGDPGLIICNLISNNTDKLYSIGFIPHWREISLDRIRNIKEEYKNSFIIDVRNPPDLVIEQILQCETIISSSLHGCIVADALGIPNVLVRISELPLGDGFKYKDYYSIYGINIMAYDIRVKSLPSIECIKNDYIISYNDVKRIATDLENYYRDTFQKWMSR